MPQNFLFLYIYHSRKPEFPSSLIMGDMTYIILQ